jgi:hypothetical protein
VNAERQQAREEIALRKRKTSGFVQLSEAAAGLFSAFGGGGGSDE